jgi:hypothetical protein
MHPDVNPLKVRTMHNLAPLTEKQMRDAERDRVYIFNVAPREHRIMVGRQYIIPARPKTPGARVSDPLVIPGTVYTTALKKSHGLDCEFEWVATDGIDIARDIIGTAPFKDPSENLTPFGVFLSMEPVPSEEAIVAAETLWMEKCGEKVAEGDRLAAINGGVVDIGGGRTASNIGKDHLEALSETGLTRNWSGINKRQTICEECGTSNMPTASMCKGCDAVFDEERARKSYPHKFHNEPTESRRGPGRPRATEQVA